MASGGYIIRGASSSDLEGIVELIDPESMLLDEYYNRVATIKYAVTHGARGCLVAEEENLIIGFLRYGVSRLNSVTTLEDLIVKQERRRQGVGSALLMDFLNNAQGKPIVGVNLLDERYVKFLSDNGFHKDDDDKKFMEMRTDGEAYSRR